MARSTGNEKEGEEKRREGSDDLCCREDDTDSLVYGLELNYIFVYIFIYFVPKQYPKRKKPLCMSFTTFSLFLLDRVDKLYLLTLLYWRMETYFDKQELSSSSLIFIIILFCVRWKEARG